MVSNDLLMMKLLEAGFTQLDFRRLEDGDPAVLRAMRETMLGHQSWAPFKDLIHGVDTPAIQILLDVQMRLAGYGGVARFSWAGYSKPPAPSKKREVATVLDIQLGTPRETFAFALTWAAHGKEVDYLDMNQGDRFEPIPGAEEFTPWTMQWRRLRLDRAVGDDTHKKLAPEKALGATGLFVAAQHPERIRQGNTKNGGFGLLLNGLRREDQIPSWEKGHPGNSWYHPAVVFSRENVTMFLGPDKAYEVRDHAYVVEV